MTGDVKDESRRSRPGVGKFDVFGSDLSRQLANTSDPSARQTRVAGLDGTVGIAATIISPRKGTRGASAPQSAAIQCEIDSKSVGRIDEERGPGVDFQLPLAARAVDSK